MVSWSPGPQWHSFHPSQPPPPGYEYSARQSPPPGFYAPPPHDLAGGPYGYGAPPLYDPDAYYQRPGDPFYWGAPLGGGAPAPAPDGYDPQAMHFSPDLAVGDPERLGPEYTDDETASESTEADDGGGAGTGHRMFHHPYQSMRAPSKIVSVPYQSMSPKKRETQAAGPVLRAVLLRAPVGRGGPIQDIF